MNPQSEGIQYANVLTHSPSFAIDSSRRIHHWGPLAGGGGEGDPMSHVNFKKWQCPPIGLRCFGNFHVNFKKAYVMSIILFLISINSYFKKFLVALSNSRVKSPLLEVTSMLKHKVNNYYG